MLSLFEHREAADKLGQPVPAAGQGIVHDALDPREIVGIVVKRDEPTRAHEPIEVSEVTGHVVVVMEAVDEEKGDREETFAKDDPSRML